MGNFFTDTIKTSPLYLDVNRVDDTSLLEPTFLTKAQAVITAAQAIGIPMMIFETYRSQTRQQQLFAQGATKLKVVGVHHYGIAVDIVKNIGGPSWKGDFTFLAKLAKDQQLIWGGDWGQPQVHHTLYDAVHLQWCSVADQGKLFSGRWYPTVGYDPYTG